MEEDIKILKELIEFLERNDVEDLYSDFTPEIKAIENLINRNKELKKENESLVRQYEYQGALMVNEYFSKKQVFELFISKSKLKEKIEEYREKRNKLADGHFWDEPDNINQDRALFIAGETLKLLLEE